MVIQGEWTGVIIYGKEYSAYRDKELLFDMTVMQNADSINGTAQDIGGVGVSPHQASINGFFNGKQITFIKQYSSFHYYRNEKMEIDESRVGNEIHYSGVFDEAEEVFRGNWMMKGKVKLFGFLPLSYKNTGLWMMKRKQGGQIL